MPWLLYRYILGELLRVMVLTTGILVTIIAFGAAIKPLTNEDLLSAGQTAKYIGLAIVPMLQFALPFAAGFAATIVLHRLTTDNEVNAAAVSGISYPRLLLPIAGLGVVLVLVMLFLTQSLIPVFLRQMQLTMTNDVTKLFERAIAQGRPFVAGDMQIFADRLIVDPNPPDREAEQRLIFVGFAAAELDEQQRVKADVSARHAVADVYRIGDGRMIMLSMTDVVGYNGTTGELGSFPQLAPDKPIVLRDFTKQGTQFFSQSQLLHLRDDPDGFGRVDDTRAELAGELREVQLWELLDQQLQSQGLISLRFGSDRVYAVHADQLQHGVLRRTNDAPVEVIEMDRGTASRRFTSTDVRMRRSQGESIVPSAFDLVFANVRVEDFRSGVANVRAELPPLLDLTVADLPPDPFKEQSSSALLGLADQQAAPAATLAEVTARLRHNIEKLRWDIDRQLHRRYALSLIAPLLLLLGTVLAIWLRTSTPLVVYIWAFVPSILTLILITSGTQMIGDGKLIFGTIVTWMGVAALALLTLWVLARVARH